MAVKSGGRPYTYDVAEMLTLRAQGATYSELGRKYGKDHTTIMHSCKKFGVQPGVKVIRDAEQMPVITDPDIREQRRLKRPVKKPVQDKYAHIFDEPVNPGKTYAEYLADARKRPAEKRYMETWGSEPLWTGIYASKKKKDGPTQRELDEVNEEF